MRFLVPTVLFTLMLGCGVGPNSPEVGGECATDRDCAKICSMESAFGTGMCTLRCDSDQDCAEGSVCVDKDDGMCAVSCSVADDCAGFGRAYTCKEMKRMSDGEVSVCRLP